MIPHVKNVNSEGSPRRQIRFFADWGADTPLWESGTETYLMSPNDYNLSQELSNRLLAWAAHWNRHYHWEHGWDSPQAAEESKAEGDELVEALRLEVSHFADVIDAR